MGPVGGIEILGVVGTIRTDGLRISSVFCASWGLPGMQVMPSGIRGRNRASVAEARCRRIRLILIDEGRSHARIQHTEKRPRSPPTGTAIAAESRGLGNP